jgi:polo-like kinase 1
MNELLKRRKRLTELEVQCYSVQIIQAMKYLHANRVIHRDLKLGNFFLSEKMEVKIGDFGLATKLEFDGEKKKTICGTPNYIAPEILEGKSGHSYEVDVWSLGVIIYTLLVGKPPFETPDVKTTYKKIRMNSYSFPEHVPLSDASKGLITKILNLDPSKRPTLDEILQHPFLNHGGTIPKLLPVSTIACPPSASYQAIFTSRYYRQS